MAGDEFWKSRISNFLLIERELNRASSFEDYQALQALLYSTVEYLLNPYNESLMH
jgi:hypothetical protein